MDGMDLLQGVQDADSEGAMPELPPDMGQFKMPSLEQMVHLLEKMDIPEEEKAKIMEGFTNKADVLAKLAGQGAGRINDAMSHNRGIFDPYSGGSYYLLLLMLSIIVMIFAFFGYKLYKSLTDKERKREEKRKLKQMKKKK
ncbi:uncharacterized protein [Atheta coriaria]|uniref:uncharacterized protein n=1 Tax=Dalotia coriaria TaxID=877792 RepID=UPI0031F361C2